MPLMLPAACVYIQLYIAFQTLQVPWSKVSLSLPSLFPSLFQISSLIRLPPPAESCQAAVSAQLKRSRVVLFLLLQKHHLWSWEAQGKKAQCHFSLKLLQWWWSSGRKKNIPGPGERERENGCVCERKSERVVTGSQ